MCGAFIYMKYCYTIISNKIFANKIDVNYGIAHDY